MSWCWGRNDRLIGTPITPVNQPEAKSLNDIETAHLDAIESFFIAYNRAQGRDFHVSGRAGPREALRLVREAQQRFTRAEPHRSRS